MLVEKDTGIQSGSVISVKLVNGDELVGRLNHETTDAFHLDQPLTVVPTQSGIKLMQAMFSVDPTLTFVLSKSHVMLYNNTAEKLADHYREMTTGIKTVRNESRIIL